MWRLLVLIARRNARREAGVTALIMGSAAAGVFLLVAAQPTIELALRELRQSVDRATGAASLVVSAIDDRGLGMEDLSAVRAVPDVTAAVPVVDGPSHVHGIPAPCRVVGVPIMYPDAQRLFREIVRAAPVDGWRAVGDRRTAAAITDDLAAEGHLNVGDAFELAGYDGDRRFVVAAVVRRDRLPIGSERLTFVRLDAAQELFNRRDGFDRIEVGVGEAADLGVVRGRLEHVMASRGRVYRPHGRLAVRAMVDGFSLTTAFLGTIVLIASGFIVAGAVSVRLADRRREVALLRAAGATRVQVAGLLIADAVLVGAVGSVLGALAGMAAAGPVVARAGNLVEGLAMRAPAMDGITVRLDAAVVAAAGGVVASMVAACLAVAVQTAGAEANALRRLYSPRAGRIAGRAVWVAATLLALSPWTSAWAGWNALSGPAASVLFVPATFLLVPFVAMVAGDLLLRLSRGIARGPALLAARNLSRDRFRLALPITVLALAFEVGTAVGVVACSFERRLVQWMSGLAGDSLFVVAGDSLLRRSSRRLPADLEHALGALPGVERLRPTLERTAVVDGGEVVLRVTGTAAPLRPADLQRYHFAKGDDRTAIERLVAGEGVLISENLAFRSGLRIGDVVPLTTAAGPWDAPVLGIVVDFSSPGGTVIVGRSAYTQRWGDDSVDGLFLDLSPGAEPEAMRAAVAQVVRGFEGLTILSAPDVVHDVSAMVHRAVVPLYAIAVVTLAIGICGMAQSLLAAAMARGAEQATLHAVGASRWHVGAVLTLEGVGAVLTAALLGTGAGALGAYGWLRGTLPSATGWLVAYAAPVSALTWSVMTALVSTPIVLLWPALVVARSRPERWSLQS